ncbi:MAG: NAD(P)/FAD-dependent oxidoreductase [Steroidobacteraceae bacterium]
MLGEVEPLLIPMRDRCIHEHDGSHRLLPYGQRPHEVNHSVSRADLNLALVRAAARHPGIELRFGQACLGARLGEDRLVLRDAATSSEYTVPLAPTIAADGAGSALRRSLESAGIARTREEPLGHAYKELTIPATTGGRHRIAAHALHIWPRGGFMLIALPNTDGTFTATLFLPRTGPVSFAALHDSAAARALFEREFPSALPLLPDLEAEWRAHPEGQLGTIHCDRWHAGGQLLLIGDAAHAIVPFHGQGMNCAFEDCVEFAAQLAARRDCAGAFAQYEHGRRSDVEAIARMALENYVEMRDTVRDPRFERLKILGLRLEQRHPRQFIPRYSMVTFHPEIPYSEALRRGELQQRVLEDIEARLDGADPATADLGYADALVAASGL